MLGMPWQHVSWLYAQEPKVNGEQAAQTITVCAPQQVSIPEGERLAWHQLGAAC